MAGLVLCTVTRPGAAPHAGLASSGVAPSLSWNESGKEKVSRAYRD